MKKLLLSAVALVCTALCSYAADSDLVLNDDGTVTITVTSSGSDKKGSGQVYRNPPTNQNTVFPYGNYWILFQDYATYGRLKITSSANGNPIYGGGSQNEGIAADTRRNLYINTCKDNGSSTLTFSFTDANPQYYISHYEFVAVPQDNAATYTVNGTTLEAGGTKISKDCDNRETVTISLSSSVVNKNIWFNEFKVTLTPNPAMPLDEAQEKLAEYKAGNNTAMTQSTLFTAAEVIAATEGISIDEDTDDYEANLEAKKREVDALAMKKVCEFYDGKKVAFYNRAGTPRKYMKKSNANGKITNGDAYLTPDAVWVMTFSDDNEFIMRNLVDDKYAVNLNLNATEETAGKYKFEKFDTFKDGFVAIRDCSTTESNPWLNDNTTDGTLQYKQSESGNTQSYWLVILIDEQAMVEEIQSLIPPFGTTPSTVTVSDENREAYEALQTRAAALTVDNLYTEGYELSIAQIPEYSLNPVKPGTLIRIKSNGGWYYSATTSGATFVQNQTAATVFYYAPYVDASHDDQEGGHLISLEHGVAAVQDASKMLASVTSAADNKDLATNATHVFFDQSLKGELCYHFNFYNTKKRYVYNAGNATINGGEDLTSSTANFANYTYSIEQVDEITVNINSADRIKGLVAPVAIILPVVDDVEYYHCVSSTGADGNLGLSFEKIDVTADEPVTVAPGTPLMIKSPAVDEITFKVDYDYAEPALLAEEGASRFGGSHLLLAADPADGQAIYVKSDAELPQNFQDKLKNNGNEMNFVRLNAGESVPVGAVTVALDDDQKENEKTNNVVLSLVDTHNGTTVIEEITVANRPASEAIYDLQGRRLSAPVHGINIINGHKVIR